VKAKHIATGLLLAFVAASVAVLVAKEVRRAGPQAGPPAGGPAHRLVAYYFHPNKRCASCMKIEAMAHEALFEGFPEAAKDGRIEWHVLNYEEPANRHFVKDFDIAASTVVLVEIRDGKPARSQNLEQVWDYLDDRAAFLKFVRGVAAAFLKEG